MSLRMHKEKGINPFLTYCPLCGGDGPDIFLAGAADVVTVCGYCGTANYGSGANARCGNCKEPMRGSPRTTSRRLQEGEKLPGSLCDDCQKKVEEEKQRLRAVVLDGGVYWQCTDCKANGAIKKGTFAKAVRDKLNVADGAECGVEFSKDDCPACGGEVSA